MEKHDRILPFLTSHSACVPSIECGAKTERRTRVKTFNNVCCREVPGSKLACAIGFSSWARKLIGTATWPNTLEMLIGPSPHLCSPRARTSHPTVKTSTWCLHERGGTAAQAVVGSIVWAFRRLKKPKSRQMIARLYALHSVCPQLSFPYITPFTVSLFEYNP